METIKVKQIGAFETMKKEFGYSNVMQVPKIMKVVLSVGVGSFKDKKKIDLVENRMAKITGQKAVRRGAKQSIANFKLRQGEPVGVITTLRGPRMLAFLDKLINVAIPATKDFRGISKTSVDDMGNMTMGIKEHIIFPEAADEELKDVFGMAITVTTTCKTKPEAQRFFELLGFPFKKDGAVK